MQEVNVWVEEGEGGLPFQAPIFCPRVARRSRGRGVCLRRQNLYADSMSYARFSGALFRIWSVSDTKSASPAWIKCCAWRMRFGRPGFFYRVWSQSQRWLKIQVTAEQCPRLTQELLAEEMIELGERWYAQEYFCQFVESIGQVFSDVSIDRAFRDEIAPLFGEPDADASALVGLEPLFVEG